MWRDHPNILRPRHSGSAFYLPRGGISGDQSGSVPPNLHEFSPIVVNSSNNSREELKMTECGGSLDPMVRALISRYQVENERLRDQLKAHSIHEELLQQRLHELSARNTALHLHDFHKKESDAVVKAMKKQLEDRDDEVRALQLQLQEQAARIAVFEETFSSLPLKNAEDPRARPSSSLPSPAPSLHTHETLCQILSSVGFLTRVFNAVKHCRTTSHMGSGCPHPLEECTTRCLQAAIRGNRETVGELMLRGHRMSCEELVIAIREEVLFCETSAVQMAGEFLAERASFVTEENISTETPLQLLENNSNNSNSAQEEGENEKEFCEGRNAVVPTVQCMPTDPTPARTKRRPTSRPTASDCEVQ